MTTRINPAVATASESHCAGPARRCTDAWIKGNSNMACASSAPRQQPAICTEHVARRFVERQLSAQCFDDRYGRIEDVRR